MNELIFIFCFCITCKSYTFLSLPSAVTISFMKSLFTRFDLYLNQRIIIDFLCVREPGNIILDKNKQEKNKMSLRVR